MFVIFSPQSRVLRHALFLISAEHLSLPLLSVAPSDRSLSVDLLPPLERLRQSYNILHYELQINSSNLDKMEVHERGRPIRTPGLSFTSANKRRRR